MNEKTGTSKDSADKLVKNTRQTYSAEEKIRIVLAGLRREESISALFAEATMIHQWKRALLEGASGVFERGGRRKPEIDEEQVKELHAKIGELAVANSFLERKLKPWGGK